MATYNRGYTPYKTWDDALRAVWDVVNGTNYSWTNNQFKSGEEALNTVWNIVNDNTPSYTNGSSYTPSYTNTNYVMPFSTLENLNMQSQAWNETNPNLSSAYSSLASWLGRYWDVAKQIGSFYDAAANSIANRENAYAQAQYNLANSLNQDLAKQRDYIYSVFWPQGTLTTEINKYYDDMWNYLASEGWRQMANVAAQWVHSGASLWLLRAQQNEAYNQAFQNYLKVKEQEINAKQSIQAQLIDYMTKLRQEYGNTTNQYILSQYQRANDLLNSLDADLKNQYTNLALAKVQGTWTGSSSASNGIDLASLVNSLGWNNTDTASAWGNGWGAVLNSSAWGNNSNTWSNTPTKQSVNKSSNNNVDYSKLAKALWYMINPALANLADSLTK